VRPLFHDSGACSRSRQFHPETTLQIFNDAIEQAYTDGFTGFRAAAVEADGLRY
jgi:hypothetical protein